MNPRKLIAFVIPTMIGLLMISTAKAENYYDLPPAPVATSQSMLCAIPSACQPVASAPSPCGPVGVTQAYVPQAAPVYAPQPIAVTACGPVSVQTYQAAPCTSCQSQQSYIAVQTEARRGLLESVGTAITGIRERRDTRVVGRLEHRISRHQHSSAALETVGVSACGPTAVMSHPGCASCGGG